MWSGTIRRLIEALTSFLNWRVRSHYYDILIKSRSIQNEYANEIEDLRSKGTPDSEDRADLIRKKLLEEQRFINTITGYYSETTNNSLSGS